MSESAAPWRALEESTPGTAAKAGEAASAVPVGVGRPAWIVGALVAAGISAAAAIWLVASSGSGTLVVEGDGPVPGRSSAAEAIGAAGVAGLGPGASGGAASAQLVVDVQGAVVRPGIVRLARGARIADAIAAAGGYGPRVAADRLGGALNLAALVKDGDQIVVPSRDDPVGAGPTPGGTGGATGGGGTAGSGGGPGPIDLNHATVAELDALPGIGPVTAAKIIAAREEQAFAAVEDLRTRKILGAATFDKVKDLVVIR
jgi:competence protein ComEA